MRCATSEATLAPVLHLPHTHYPALYKSIENKQTGEGTGDFTARRDALQADKRGRGRGQVHGQEMGRLPLAVEATCVHREGQHDSIGIQ